MGVTGYRRYQPHIAIISVLHFLSAIQVECSAVE